MHADPPQQDKRVENGWMEKMKEECCGGRNYVSK